MDAEPSLDPMRSGSVFVPMVPLSTGSVVNFKVKFKFKVKSFRFTQKCPKC